MNKVRFISGFHASVTAATLLLAVSPDPVKAADEPARADDSGSIEEIVVTATRRTANLQDVPLSITAVTGESLKKIAATDFFDYATTVPNLSFGNTGLGNSNGRSIAIRGISDANTTGFYIDDTPVAESLDPRIVDVDRIEVLRGPQGTLYGARSMGGTVRLITAQPDPGAFSGRAHASLGTTQNASDPNYAIDGALNMPLVQDRIGLRLVGVYQNDAGYMTRTYGPTAGPVTKVDNVARSETSGASAAMLFKVTDDFQVTPRIMYQSTSMNGFPFADALIPSSSSAVVLKPVSLDQRRVFDIAEASSDKWYLATIDAKWQLQIGALSSATSYFHRRTSDIEDETDFAQFAYGYANPLVNAPELDYAVNGTTQEFRLASDFKGRFNYVAGLFFNRTDTNVEFPPNYIPGLAAATGFTHTDLNYSSTKVSRQDDYAAYAEATVEVLPSLKAIGGARLYKVKSSFSAVYDGFVNGGLQVVPEEKRTESGVQPKFSLQYELGAGNQVYATAAKGFRPGGFNGLITTGFGCEGDLAALGLKPSDTLFYKSDSVWSYEAGAKTELLDRRLTANLGGFRIDWSNIQQNIGLNCGFSFRGNSGQARSQGVEVELAARPIEAFTVNFGFGYTDATFTTTPSGTNVMAGDRIPQVPRVSWTLGADYSWQLFDDKRAFLHADYRYVGDSVSVLNAATDADGKVIPRIRPSYNLVDARGGVGFGAYEVAVFAKNLTNELAVLGDARALAAELPGRARVQISQPRTIGLEVRAKF